MSGTQEKSGRKRLSAERRREQIVEATLARLSRHSPEGWTLRQVARDLGVAPSLITYFFATWNDLLLSAYGELAERYEADAATVAASGLEGHAYLEAMIDLYLGDDTRAETAGGYIALWAFSQNEPRLREQMAQFSRMAVASIAPALAACARERGIERNLGDVERTLYILLDGLWYELAVNPDYLTLAEAQEMVWSYLEGALGK